jgi:hypothetical protein
MTKSSSSSNARAISDDVLFRMMSELISRREKWSKPNGPHTSMVGALWVERASDPRVNSRVILPEPDQRALIASHKPALRRCRGDGKFFDGNLRRWSRSIIAKGKNTIPSDQNLKGDMTRWTASVVAILLARFPGVANARMDCEAIPRGAERADCYLA